jgi:hypothetical protein
MNLYRVIASWWAWHQWTKQQRKFWRAQVGMRWW